MSLPAHVIFDLDRTLVRSDHLADAWCEACALGGVTTETALAGLREHMGVPARLLAQRIGVTDPARLDLVVARFVALCDAAEPDAVTGAGEALHALRDAGARLYLSTGSSPTAASNALNAHGWTGLFDLVLGTTDTHMKGAGHYASIITASGLSADAFAASSATVGDGCSDMRYGADHRVALRAGFIYDPADPGPDALRSAGATVLFAEMAELPVLLGAAAVAPAFDPTFTP